MELTISEQMLKQIMSTNQYMSMVLITILDAMRINADSIELRSYLANQVKILTEFADVLDNEYARILELIG